MKTIWVLHSFYRSVQAQIRELERLLTCCPPDAVWILGTEDTQIPVQYSAPIRLIICPDGGQEICLQLLCAAHKAEGAALYLFPSDECGASLATRLAHRLGGASLTGVRSFHVLNDGSVHACRLCYSGHMEATFSLEKSPFCLSAELCADRDSAAIPLGSAECNQRWHLPCSSAPHVQMSVRPRPTADGISNAAMVVAIGRGAVRSEAAVAKYKELADRLGAVLGASRPVVMNGWVPEDALLGVSGSLTVPYICLALGVSGSSAFYAGIQESTNIIAINTDPCAPIFRNSDLYAVTDCEALASALLKKLENHPAGSALLSLG